MEVTDDWDLRRSAQCFPTNDPRGLEGWGTTAQSEQYDDPLPPALVCRESSPTALDQDWGFDWTSDASTNVVTTMHLGLVLLVSFVLR
jgi:hypothetical protein